MQIPVQLFSLAHLSLLALVPLVAVLACWLGGRSAVAERGVRRAIVLVLALCPPVYAGHFLAQGQSLFPFHLPLELCDISLFLAIACLLCPSQRLFDIAYYWCLLGPTMALLQPNLVEPSAVLTAHFFLSHGLTVVAVVYLVWRGGRAPGPGSVWRSAVALNLLMAAIGAFDYGFNADYMFLLRKPLTRSLLDLFGPWPWYILLCEAIGLLLFALASVPFQLRLLPPDRSPIDSPA